MEIRLNCLGNEYLVVSLESTRHPLPVLTNRGAKYSGVRGVIFLESGLGGRYRVELYNSRGVRVAPGACALRCAGYALGQGSWELETDTGVHRVEVRGRETVLSFPSPVYGGEYQIGRYFHGYLVNLGQRYFITLRRNIHDLNIQAQGEALDRYFGGVDTVFVQGDEKLQLRIWRRGGELASSCTAACAAAAVLYRLDKSWLPLHISMPGGKVYVERDSLGRFIQSAQVVEVNTENGPDP